MATDISQRIKHLYPTLSKGHKKIATIILRDSNKAAYATALHLARLADVSESTVIRFADVLGYDGYSEFQHAIQELVKTNMTLNQRIEITKTRLGQGDILQNVLESDIKKIKDTLEYLDRETFKAAVDAILRAKRIYVMGARSAECLARLFSYNLSLIFDNVIFIQPSSASEVFEQLFSVNKHDLVIAFSFPRYSTKIMNAAKFARKKSAEVLAFTDSTTSPLADHADYLITAESDMASFMDSLVAPLSIINAMIVEITRRKEKELRSRFDSLEKIWDEYDVYTKRK